MTKLIRIGNSQGIRLSKSMIEQSGLSGDLEIEAQEGQIIIRRQKSVRHNWDEQFLAMAATGEDRLLDGDTLPSTQFEDEEWEW